MNHLSMIRQWNFFLWRGAWCLILWGKKRNKQTKKQQEQQQQEQQQQNIVRRHGVIDNVGPNGD